MFPWVYGFTWEAGNLIFLTIFYSVAAVIFATFALAAIRAVRDLKSHHIDKIRWHVDFDDLPYYAKVCRHVITGELKSRTCSNGFDCRVCELHLELAAAKTSIDNVAPIDVNEPIFGLNMPMNRMYYRGHTWVQKEDDGTLTVGLDDFGQRILGKPEDVELPKVGTRLEVNGTGWYFKKADAKVRVLSPVDGEVIATGNGDAGFYLKVKPESEVDLRHLLKGTEIRPWLMREIERLQFMLATEKVGVSLADGGEIVNDLPGNYPDADWDSVLGEMFLHP